MIYYALFHSIISYGIIFWGSWYKDVQRVQERLIILIHGKQFHKVNVLNLRQLFTAITHYYIELYLLYKNRPMNIRHRYISLPKRKPTVGSKGSYYNAIKIFNYLLVYLKDLNDRKKRINKKVKTFILKNLSKQDL